MSPEIVSLVDKRWKEYGHVDERRRRPPTPVRAFLRLVMIEHSIFALPFAYVAALTAMPSTAVGCGGSTCC